MDSPEKTLSSSSSSKALGTSLTPTYKERVPASGIISNLLRIRRPRIGRDISINFTRSAAADNFRYPGIAVDETPGNPEFDKAPDPEPEKPEFEDFENEFGLDGEWTNPDKDGGRKKNIFIRKVRKREIINHIEGLLFPVCLFLCLYFCLVDLEIRKKFILTLAKSLLSFGAPSHRIESQLGSAAKILRVNAAFVHLPAVIIVSYGDRGTKTSEMHFVRSAGRIALSRLHKVHKVYRAVLHDRMGPEEGMRILSDLLTMPPVYSLWLRCILSFFCSTIICSLAFGGSILDMFIGGAFASILQYLGLNTASRSSIYANVYE
jgi:hypothetical protein